MCVCVCAYGRERKNGRTFFFAGLLIRELDYGNGLWAMGALVFVLLREKPYGYLPTYAVGIWSRG